MTLGQTYLATDFMRTVLPYQGRQPLEIVILVLFAILFAWVSAGFWTAVAGFFLMLFGKDRYAISARVTPDRPIDPATVGIVDLRAPVVGHAPVVLAALVHARQRRDADPLDRLARIQGGVDIHDQGGSGRDDEAIGAGYAGRIEQCIDRQLLVASGGSFEPEVGKAREFFRSIQPCVDSEPAC